MVLPRRNHVRVSRRHRGAGFVGLALVGIVFYLSYSWYRPLTSSFGSRRPSSSSLTTFSSMTALNAGSYKPPPDGIPLRVNISESNPRNWRNPERDFDTEYEQVLEAFPALRTTRRARIAFFIMAHGPTDVMLLARSFPWLYSPLNFYLIHMDRKSSDKDRKEVMKLVEGLPNARMLEPAQSVSWGGFSITLTALFGISTLVEWSKDWDYFINLSASDFPLMTAVEMSAAMGTFVDSRVNFVTGSAMMEQNRAELYVDDQGLYRANETRKAAQPFLQRSPRVRVERPLPNLFTLFKGEFWVALHRDFCEYIHESPDNVARSLQAYFAKFRISDESFFQTTLCHPNAPEAFPVHNDNLRLINWPPFDPETEWVLHPDPVQVKHVPKLMTSGALFARKFVHGMSDEAWSNIEDILSNKGTIMRDRIARVLKRGLPARSVQGRGEFCAVPAGYNLGYVLRHQKVKKERKTGQS
ncbi:unnamed protein product [Ascophyllum nodosum]